MAAGNNLITYVKNELVISCTFFQHETIHKLTWILPGGRTSNQINHTTFNRNGGLWCQSIKLKLKRTRKNSEWLFDLSRIEAQTMKIDPVYSGTDQRVPDLGRYTKRWHQCLLWSCREDISQYQQRCARLNKNREEKVQKKKNHLAAHSKQDGCKERDTHTDRKYEREDCSQSEI